MAGSRLLYIIFLLSMILPACQSPALKPKPLREPNLADIYNPGQITLRPDFSIHHINDSISVLYVRVFPAELLFSQANEEGELRARLRISYEMRFIDENSKAGVLADSISLTKVLNRNDARNSFFTGLPLRAFIGNKYFLTVKVVDELRRTRNQTSLILDKSNRFTAQNYKIVSARTGIPVFSSTLTKGQYFRLQFNQMGYDSIYIDFYNPDKSLPRPVFSTVPEAPIKTYPDTSWVYPYNDTINYELFIPGTYVFRLNKESREGITLMNFGDYYPRIGTADDMLGPLVYLTSTTEFRDLRMQQNRKLAVDNFWLGIAGTTDAAREIIRVYYNRVNFANVNFTSFKEGWKTDRGMIYIIFGVPNSLEIDADSEKWTYFTGRNTNPIEFVFQRKENHFTNLDYQAVKDISSNPYWRTAVNSWRKGKIYSSIN